MNKKYLILGGVLIAVGGIGYLLYKKFVIDVNKEKMATELEQQQAEAMAQSMAENMGAMTTNPIKDVVPSINTFGDPVVAYSPSGQPLTNSQLLAQFGTK
jgi:hypothetical protein